MMTNNRRLLSTLVVLATILCSCTLLASDIQRIHITSIYPTGGPTSGSTRVTVRGEEIFDNPLYPTPQCRFGLSSPTPGTYVKCTPRPIYKERSSVEVKNMTCIQCEHSPASEMADIVPLSVSMTGDFIDSGNSAPFNYYKPPAISKVLPRHGLGSGKTNVTVTGEGFFDTQEDLLCGFGARIVKAEFISNTEVKCVSPAAEVTQNHGIPFGVTLNDQQFTAPSVTYYYYDDPFLSAPVPYRIPTTGGVSVELWGQFFDPYDEFVGIVKKGTAYVQVAGYKLDVEILSDTRAKFIVPPSEKTIQVPVILTLNDQQYSNPVYIEYYRPPHVSTLSPRLGPVRGGTVVSVVGSGFDPDQPVQCRFGDKVIEGVLVSVNEIHCTSPKVTNPGYVDLAISQKESEWSAGDTTFLYYENPTLKSINPTCGPTTGYTQIGVWGENFIEFKPGMIKCVFGGKLYMDAVMFNSTYLECDSPPVLNESNVVIDDKWTYDVEISLNGPDDKYGPALQFDYYTQPKIHSLTPNGGFTIGGSVITIKRDEKHGAFDQAGTCKVMVRFSTFESATIPLASSDKTGNAEEDGTVVSKTYKGREYTYVEVDPYYNEDEIVINAPDITIGETCYQTLPEEVTVNVALNGQQFTDEHAKADWNAGFIFMEPPTFFTGGPYKGPSTGNTHVHISGRGILPPLSRKQKFKGIDDEFNPDEDGDIAKGRRLNNALDNVTIRFVDTEDPTKVYGEATIDEINDSKVDFRTPAGETGRKARILYSPNDGQDWMDTGLGPFEFQPAPRVTKVDPPFSALSDRPTITVTGTDFSCENDDCDNIKCRFGTAKQGIVVDGVYVSETEIQCLAPETKRPDVYPLEISINDGNDFTHDGKEFAYFDAFVLSLEPDIGPTSGNTNITVTGFGFADTGDNLKCRFGAKDEFKCSNNECIVDAEYVDKDHIICKTVPMEKLVYLSNNKKVKIDDEFAVEVAVYEGAFTNNNIQFSYYDNPDIDWTAQDKSGNTVEDSEVPPKYIVGGMDEEFDLEDPETLEQMKKMKARFVGPDGRVVYVPASFIHVPQDEDGPPNAIGFETPEWPTAGDVDVEISLNGLDYSSAGVTLSFPAPLKINSINPVSGPVSGYTLVTIEGTGFENPEQLHVNWGTQSSPVVTSTGEPDLFKEMTPVKVYARTCPTQQIRTDGGHAMVEIGRHTKSGIRGGSVITNLDEVSDDSDETENTTENDTQEIWYSDTLSLEEFYYYKDPKVMNIFPKAGPAAGGTVVHIEGHWFREKPIFDTTPWCKFEDTVVKAKFVSTVRLECVSPGAQEPSTVPVKVSLNGQDWTNDEIYFDYYFSPIVTRLVPTAGPKTGGTDIRLEGENFRDLAANKEFYCRFKSVEDEEMEPHYVVPSFKSENEVHCVAPGGWDTGTVATVEVTFNNRDYTNYGLTFGFYQIDEVFPLSGPAFPDEDDYIEIRGSGFTENDEAACFYGAREYAPIGFTTHMVKCPMPTSDKSENWWADHRTDQVELKITLNGRDYLTIPQGYTYYVQPKVFSITPDSGPASGSSLIKVFGSGFYDDFENASPGCLVGEVVGEATVVTSKEIHCKTGRAEVTPFDNTSVVKVALNSHSWTDPNGEATDYSIYDVFHVTPNSGPTDGDTEVMVYGVGFSKHADEARCRFGVSDNYQIVQANVMNDEKLVCSSKPGFQLPNKAKLPFAVPFSVALSDDKFEPWTNNHVKFRFYQQPRIKVVSPKEGPVDDTTEVTVVALDGTEFHKPVPIMTAGGDFNESYGLQCRFGNFGEVDAVYVNATAVKCFTPSTGLDKRKVYRIDAVVSVAQNGQDYTHDDVRYTFVGKASGAFVWLKLLAFLLLILLIIGLIAYCCQNIQIGNLINFNLGPRASSEGTSVNRSNAPRTFRDGDQVVRPKTGNVAAGDTQKTWQQRDSSLAVPGAGTGIRESSSPMWQNSPSRFSARR